MGAPAGSSSPSTGTRRPNENSLIACASGALAKRSRDAVALLDAWLEKADQSLAFRLAAYRDASKTAGNKEGSLHAPQLTAFAGGRALANRRAFRDRLASLARSDGSAVDAAPAKLAELAALVPARCRAVASRRRSDGGLVRLPQYRSRPPRK